MNAGERVLIVDDLDGTREVLREMLIEMGLNDVVEAWNGEEALRVLNNSPMTLIISDYEMGNSSGMELLKSVKSDPELSKVPFLMVSSQLDPRVMQKAIEEGADAYVTKPLRFNTLQQKISELLRRHSEDEF